MQGEVAAQGDGERMARGSSKADVECCTSAVPLVQPEGPSRTDWEGCGVGVAPPTAVCAPAQTAALCDQYDQPRPIVLKRLSPSTITCAGYFELIVVEFRAEG